LLSDKILANFAHICTMQPIFASSVDLCSCFLVACKSEWETSKYVPSLESQVAEVLTTQINLLVALVTLLNSPVSFLPLLQGPDSSMSGEWVYKMVVLNLRKSHSRSCKIFLSPSKYGGVSRDSGLPSTHCNRDGPKPSKNWM
jgi:hypothetical protein